MNRAAIIVLSIWIASFCAGVAVNSCGYQEQVKHAQVSAARVSQEVACQKHLKRFLDGKDEGLSCDASRIRAAAENPLCNLSFSCPARDAGTPEASHEGGVE